jgi:hypothetical protein
MSGRIILFLFGITPFFLPYFAFANVEINEIMYDLKTGTDSGREWVEIFNNSDTPVDLSAFKFFEGDTNHKLKLAQGDVKLGAKNYAVIVSDIVKFKIDWPNFSGTILDSTFSLSNSGEILAIKDTDKILDEFTYQSSLGGAGDGKSLQKINGVWTPATPTPGIENKLPPRQSAGEAELKTKVLFPTKVPIEQNKNLTQEIINKEEIFNQSLPVPAVEDDMENGDNHNYLFIAILIFLLSVSGGTVYFIRRKKIATDLGDDFEILEE